MNRTKVCIFLLLMLPNIACSSALISVIQVALSSVFAGACSTVGGGAGLFGGVVLASVKTVQDARGNLQHSAEEKKKQACEIIGGSAFIGAMLGGTAGWQAGSALMFPVRAADSLIETLRSP